MELVEFTLQDNTTVLIEVQETEVGAIERVSLPSGRMIIQAQQTFEEALDKVKPLASSILNKLKGLNTPADEIEVKFGIKLTADAGAIFTTIGGEVNFEVTLKWKNEKAN